MDLEPAWVLENRSRATCESALVLGCKMNQALWDRPVQDSGDPGLKQSASALSRPLSKQDADHK